MKTINADNLTYPVVETFHSVQGEGAWTGVNAFFIRLGGCDVRCPWCFASGTLILMADLTEKSIETIQIGDEVITLDRGKLVRTKVTAVHPPRMAEVIRLEFESGVVTYCTPEHQYKLLKSDKLRQAQYIQEAYSLDLPQLDCTQPDINYPMGYLVVAVLGDSSAIARKARQLKSEGGRQCLKPDKVVNRLSLGATQVYNFATEHGYYFANQHLVKNCDTKESWNPKRHPRRSVIELAQEAKAANPAIVIITGGEPLMHDLNPLTEQLHRLGMQVHLETSGAHPFSGNFDWVTFSPKRFNPPHESVYDHVNELKVVVVNAEDLQWAEQHAARVPPETVKYLQPEWNTLQSKELIFEYVLQHSEWRISLQTHKFLGIR